LQLPGVREHTELRSNVLRFAGLGVGFLDFVVLKREQIEPLDFSRKAGGQVGEFRFGFLYCREKAANLRSEVRGVRERIDQGELAGIIEEGLLFMLAVDVQKQRSQFAQSG